MKKFLLLPLVALMFAGCSKDAMTDGTPDMAAGQTAKIATQKVTISLNGWATTRWGNGSDNTPTFPVVHYMDENQNPHDLMLRDDQGSYEFVTSSANLFISGFAYCGDKPYIGIKVHTNDTHQHPDGGYRGFYTGYIDEVPSSIHVPLEEPVSSPDDSYKVVLSVGESYYPMSYEEF